MFQTENDFLQAENAFLQGNIVRLSKIILDFSGAKVYLGICGSLLLHRPGVTLTLTPVSIQIRFSSQNNNCPVSDHSPVA